MAWSDRRACPVAPAHTIQTGCLDPAAARAAGHPDVVAPPTFTIAFVLPAIESFLRDPATGWDYAHMVHAEQRRAGRRAGGAASGDP